MALIRILSFTSLLACSVSCMDQYSPYAFWEKIDQERQASREPSVIVADDGSRISLGDDGKLQVVASDAPVHDPTTDTAETIYTQVCALCHGKNGEGVPNNAARAFTDTSWQKEATDHEISWIIKHGTIALMNASADDTEKQGILQALKKRKTFKALTGGMAPNGGRISAPLTDEQVQGLTRLIRSFNGK